MKIAQIITRSDTLGGASVHVRDLSKKLAEQGHEVCVFVGGDGPIISLFRNEGITTLSVMNLVRELSPLSDIKAYFQLKKMMCEFAPDIIACHSAKAGLIGRLVARRLSVPSVYTAHGWPFTQGVPRLKASFYRLVEKAMAKLTSRIIAVSNYDKKLALTTGVAQSELVDVVWNGVSDVSQPVNTDVPIKHKQIPVIVMVARFESPKNYRLLLESLFHIKNEEWCAKLIGDGPDLESVKSFASELGLIGRVEFLGWRSDTCDILRNADIFALISNWEGLPLSILEAMQCRLPVVASDVGGVSEAVINDETGILVSNDNMASVVLALKKLVLDKNIRVTMGELGRARYESLFTVEKMVSQTFAVYERAVEKNKT